MISRYSWKDLKMDLNFEGCCESTKTHIISYSPLFLIWGINYLFMIIIIIIIQFYDTVIINLLVLVDYLYFEKWVIHCFFSSRPQLMVISQ